MKVILNLSSLALCSLLIGCGSKGHSSSHEHDHEEGESHAEDHGHEHGEGDPADEHEHEEVSLGTFSADGMVIGASQGHGAVVAGKESHLVIKLPYKDNGSTMIRAWLGSADRTLSSVGKGEYATKHDDYEIHAIAPSPLPADVQWWVEIEKPDGTKAIGSIAPKM